jgi:zinc protease
MIKKSFLISTLLFLYIGSFAQNLQQLTLDSRVTKGVLDNGLTYYILSNSEPKDLAEFYFIQKSGSIHEEDNQRGVSHFLEHMAFNGSTNFPGSSLITYLEGVGVKYGTNLNAYTAADYTVFNISAVPVTRSGVIDSTLLILYDWASQLSLEDADIEKERGVIREEIRARNVANIRMFEKMVSEIMPGSKYAERLPIGISEVIETLRRQELKEFYNKWYRPDLQTIIVVGDVDSKSVEQKIKRLFSSIPKPDEPIEIIDFKIPDNSKPLISVVSDPEATSTNIRLMYKHNALSQELLNTRDFLVFDYMNSLITKMLSGRLSEKARTPDSPLLNASASFSDFFLTNRVSILGINAISREGEIEESLETIINESERVKRFGFTPSEYKRARADYMMALGMTYNERDKLSNTYFLRQILIHTLTGKAMPGLEERYSIMKQIDSVICLEQINSHAKFLTKDENIIISVMMPLRESHSTLDKDSIINIYYSSQKSYLEPYTEEINDDPLVTNNPIPGTILSSEVDSTIGSQLWRLSNGATVIVKKSDFKRDEIMLRAISPGGFSLIDSVDPLSAKVVNDILLLGGVGNYNISDLKKVLTGKSVSALPGITISDEFLNGVSTPGDIETFMKLVYLYFTSIREDSDSFNSYVNRKKAEVLNSKYHPSQALSDTIQKTLYNDHFYSRRLSSDMIESIDYKRTLNLARERFSNAADFTFIFIGNVDENILKPLIEKYIASLPSIKGRTERWNNVGYEPVKGVIKNHFEREMQTPTATVYSAFSAYLEYNTENFILSQITSELFNMIFTRTIREEEQGTYGVGVNVNLNFYPVDHLMFTFRFNTDTGLKERLLARAYKEIDNIIDNGVLSQDFNNIIEFLLKKYSQNIRENVYWLNIISNRCLTKRDLHTEYLSILKRVTPDRVQKFIKDALSQENRLEIIMTGKRSESN